MSGDTVYLVWEIDWEDQAVLSIWTTRDAAEADLGRAVAQGYSYSYDITERVLDEPVELPTR